MRPAPTPKPIAPNIPKGICCPKCGCGHFEVLYTRATPAGTIRRRRQCRHCGRRVTTSERIGA
ncbi:MAG: NrdR family transcriptional regulator [Phycisphaerales bacterium]